MIKTIAIAALGTFVASAPALAVSGPVLQDRSVTGEAVRGVAQQRMQPSMLDHHTTEQSMQSATSPTRATVLVPVDAELAGKPMQVACLSGCGGIKFNGVVYNGLKWNGIRFNGMKFNDIKWNGITWNGLRMNGITWNGRTLNGAKLNGLVLNGFTLNGTTLNGIVLNGWSLNGIVYNGWSMNGMVLNGFTLNGLTLNGKFLNGKMFNGTETGAVAERVDASLTVTAVTLPGGERVAIAD